MTPAGAPARTSASQADHRIDPVPRISIQAFCETAEAAAVISAAAADRRMAKAQVKQNMGGASAAIEAYRNAPTPNVVVLEAPLDGRNLVEQLDELAHLCDAGTRVVVLGRTNDIVLYRQLVARGVNEYLVAPFEAVDFLRAISQLFRTPGAKPLGRLIGVVGAKGGVGASTIAHNLAWSLASITEMATIIADLDIAFGTAALNYNQDPPQGVADAVFDPERVDATLVDRVLSKCGDNLSLLAAPATLDRVARFFGNVIRYVARRFAQLRRRGPCSTCRTSGADGLDALCRGGRDGRGRKSGSRRSAQHEKSDRPSQGRAPARPPSTACSQRRWA